MGTDYGKIPTIGKDYKDFIDTVTEQEMINKGYTWKHSEFKEPWDDWNDESAWDWSWDTAPPWDPNIPPEIPEIPSGGGKDTSPGGSTYAVVCEDGMCIEFNGPLASPPAAAYSYTFTIKTVNDNECIAGIQLCAQPQQAANVYTWVNSGKAGSFKNGINYGYTITFIYDAYFNGTTDVHCMKVYAGLQLCCQNQLICSVGAGCTNCLSGYACPPCSYC